MDARRLDARVDAPVRVYGRTANTTDWVRSLGHEGAPAGALAVADELTAAVGRSGDAWSAPSGGVWASLLLRPDLGPAHAGRLTIAGGLAVAEVVRERGVDARLTWPNDVVVVHDEPRKLAGVLPEVVVDGVPVAGKPVDEALDEPGDLQFAVLGVGLNANLDPGDPATDRAVTTLRAETGGDVDRTAIVVALHERVRARAAQAETDDAFAALLADWRDLAVTVGTDVRVRTRAGEGGGGGEEELVGRATGVDERGALVVETDDGERRVTEGECDRVRRA